MSSNVSEWTSTADGTNRVYRGGGWRDSVRSWVRAASRNSFVPELRDGAIGFRCAREVM
jgi:formylglycine-generating enzyme required for sulfatase activity